MGVRRLLRAHKDVNLRYTLPFSYNAVLTLPFHVWTFRPWQNTTGVLLCRHVTTTGKDLTAEAGLADVIGHEASCEAAL